MIDQNVVTENHSAFSGSEAKAESRCRGRRQRKSSAPKSCCACLLILQPARGHTVDHQASCNLHTAFRCGARDAGLCAETTAAGEAQNRCGEPGQYSASPCMCLTARAANYCPGRSMMHSALERLQVLKFRGSTLLNESTLGSNRRAAALACSGLDRVESVRRWRAPVGFCRTFCPDLLSGFLVAALWMALKLWAAWPNRRRDHCRRWWCPRRKYLPLLQQGQRHYSSRHRSPRHRSPRYRRPRPGLPQRHLRLRTRHAPWTLCSES